MISLAWKIKELSDLNETGRQLRVDINGLIERLRDEHCDWREANIPRRLATIRQRVVTFIRGTARHRRTAATHVLVFMVSPEERNQKPYALPVQCIPYKGISDAKVRELANKVIHEMVQRKMKVAGNSCLLSIQCLHM